MLVSEKWTLLARNTWKSTYWHAGMKMLLVVYVDDFRMSGPEQNFPKAWETIRKHIKTSDPQKSGKFLGCDHKRSSKDIPTGGDPWSVYDENDKAERVRINLMEYDMEPFLDSCVERYCELAKVPRSSLKYVETPFINEQEALKQEKETVHQRDEILEQIEKLVGQLKDLKGKELEKRTRELTGTLSPIASKILMKLLYAARLARWDLLRAIGFLATQITKWTAWSDKRLYRIICYVNSTHWLSA